VLRAFAAELQRVQQHEKVCAAIAQVVQEHEAQRHTSLSAQMVAHFNSALREQESWCREHGLVVRPRPEYLDCPASYEMSKSFLEGLNISHQQLMQAVHR
jgi:hypothetical protein